MLQMFKRIKKREIQKSYEKDDTNEFQKRIIHDYANQLNCIQGLLRCGQYQKALQYVEKLTCSFYDGVDAIDVHNPVINVILNQKYHRAEEKGVAMSFQINDLAKLWMEDIDTVILLSNLLDNAIEASEMSAGKKIIEMKMILEKKHLILSVKNTVDKPVDIQDNSISTKKKDKNNNGIGLKNVQRVLDKYDGIGMMRYEKGWFRYTISIPENN